MLGLTLPAAGSSMIIVEGLSTSASSPLGTVVEEHEELLQPIKHRGDTTQKTVEESTLYTKQSSKYAQDENEHNMPNISDCSSNSMKRKLGIIFILNVICLSGSTLCCFQHL